MTSPTIASTLEMLGMKPRYICPERYRRFQYFSGPLRNVGNLRVVRVSYHRDTSHSEMVNKPVSQRLRS